MTRNRGFYFQIQHASLSLDVLKKKKVKKRKRSACHRSLSHPNCSLRRIVYAIFVLSPGVILGDRKEQAKRVLLASCLAAPSRGQDGHCICPEAVFPDWGRHRMIVMMKDLVSRTGELPEKLGELRAS